MAISPDSGGGGGAPAQTFQDVYDFTDTAQPKVAVTAARGPLTVRDAAVSIGDLVVLEDNAGVDFFRVREREINFGLTGSRLVEIADDGSTSRGSIRYLPDGRTQTAVPTVGAYALQWDSLVVSNIPGGAPFGNDTAPALVGSIGECRFDDPGNLFSSALLFNQATTMTANGVNVGPAYTMVNQPTVRTGTLGGSRTFSQANAVRSQMKVGPNIAGNVTLTSHEPFFATIIIDATVGTASATTVNYFAAKAPTLTAGGTVGTLHCLDLPAIPGAGITNLRGIASAMSAGEFIRHTGSAPAQFGGAVQLGSGATFDVSLSRGAANRLDLAAGDTFRAVGGTVEFVDTTARVAVAVAGEMGIFGDRVHVGQAPAGSDHFFAIAAIARTVGAGSDNANCLNTTGGLVTFSGLVGTFAQWIVNAPSSTGTAPTDAANMVIQTSVSHGVNRYGLLITANPGTGGGGVGAALRVTAGLARFDGRVDINRPIALGGGATPTLGTIGGTGPTVAAQAQWVEIDIGGVAHWIPVWT